MTNEEIGRHYAQRITQAGITDALAQDGFMVKAASFSGRFRNLTNELTFVAGELRAMKYDTGGPIDEATRSSIIDSILDNLNLPKTSEYRDVIKAGSVDSQLKVQQQIENIIQNLKRGR